jgi:ADP-heptose:LPS heptosyltransferase
MNTNENVLLIRLRSIGDILLTLPAVHVVRDNFPGAKIAFLVSKEFVPIIAGFRDVDEVIALDRALYRRGNPKAIIVETFSLLRRLRRKKFSLAVDFQGYGETALLTWLTRAPRRWGSVYQPARGWAYTHGVRRDSLIHPAEWNISLLGQCGLQRGQVRNEFVLPDSALDEARRFFAAQGLDTAKPTLFVQPFTSSPHKNWPLENYLALAGHWRERGLQILFGGGALELAALDPARDAGYPVAAGAPLPVAAGLMGLCSLIVGGDTGLLHLAVAMGKRVVMLMGPTAQSSPFRHPDWAVRPPSGQAVSSIVAGTVIDACRQAFADIGLRTLSMKSSTL